jgi:hypothetical protein
MWKFTIINTSGVRVMNLVLGTGQAAIGTSISANVGALEVVTFEMYLTATSYLTVRTSTQGI